MQYPTMQYATCIISYTVYMISEMHCNTCQVSVFKSIHPDMLGEPGAFQEGIKLFTSNQRRPSWTSSVWIFISCISVSGGQKRKASFDSASSKRRNKFPGKNDHQVFQATFNTRRCFYFPARPISHGSKADWILSCGAHLLFLARPKWKAWSRTTWHHFLSGPCIDFLNFQAGNLWHRNLRSTCCPRNFLCLLPPSYRQIERKNHLWHRIWLNPMVWLCGPFGCRLSAVEGCNGFTAAIWWTTSVQRTAMFWKGCWTTSWLKHCWNILSTYALDHFRAQHIEFKRVTLVLLNLHLYAAKSMLFGSMDSVYVSSDLQGALGMPRSFQRGGYKGTGHLAVFDKQQNPPCGSKVKAAMTREFNTGGHAVKVPRRVAMVFSVFQMGVATICLNPRWWSPARVKSVKPQQRHGRSRVVVLVFFHFVWTRIELKQENPDEVGDDVEKDKVRIPRNF